MPGAEQFSKHHIVLPIYPALRSEHIGIIVKAAKKVLASVAQPNSDLKDASKTFLASRKVVSLSSGLFLFLDE